MIDKIKMSFDDLLIKWTAYLRDEAKELRYMHADRMTHLELLVGWALSLGYDREDIELNRRKIFDLLITKDGKKGKGKYEGWPDAVNEDIDAIIGKYFIDAPDTEKIEPKSFGDISKTARSNFKKDERMCNWLKSKYSRVTSGMIEEVHEPGTILWMEFIVDNFSE